MSGQERLPAKGEILRWAWLPMRRYARFEGRSGRREFWWFTAAQFLIYLVLVGLFVGAVVLGIAEEERSSTAQEGWIFVFIGAFGAFALLYIALFIPTLAVTVRRLHDLGISGWVALPLYLACWFLSFIGWIIYAIVMAVPGQDKANAYGPPVYGDQLAPIFE